MIPGRGRTSLSDASRFRVRKREQGNCFPIVEASPSCSADTESPSGKGIHRSDFPGGGKDGMRLADYFCLEGGPGIWSAELSF